MEIPSETLAFWWDNSWDDSGAGTASTLLEQLRTQERAVGKLFSQGSIASVGKNSANQTYRGPGVGSFTPAQIQVGWRMLIRLYRQVQSELTLEVSSADPQSPGTVTELAIYTRGALVLSGPPIREYQPDMTNLLLPATLGLPSPVSTT